MWADRRFTLGHGRAFFLYVIGYTIGRTWIEHLRIDPAHLIGPFRLNDYVSVGVCLLFVAIFVVSRRRHPERESSVYLPGREPAQPSAEAAQPSAEETPPPAEAAQPAVDDSATAPPDRP